MRTLEEALKANEVKVVHGSFGCLPSVGSSVVFRTIENDIVFYIVGTVSEVKEPSGQVIVNYYGGLPPQGNNTDDAQWFLVKDK